MPELRDLSRRLENVLRTRQVAGAMKNAATAKYGKLCRINDKFKGYSDAITGILDEFGSKSAFGERPEAAEKPDLILVVSGNRGLCGGFNLALFNFLADTLTYMKKQDMAPPLVAVCGRAAANYCNSKHITLLRTFEIPDIPAFETAAEISHYLCGMYSRCEVKNVLVVYEKYVNVLKQLPMAYTFLSDGGEGGEGAEKFDVQYLPDFASVGKSIVFSCLDNKMYSILLENATGIQAATLTAMRAAYDNATDTAALLRSQINKQRQSNITSGVIETSQPAEQ